MTRNLRLVGLVLASVLGCAWPAQAGLLDILEELSGPGPFGYKGNVLTTFKCLKVSAGGYTYTPHRNFGIPGEVEVKPQLPGRAAEYKPPPPAFMPCFFADFRRLQSLANDNFRNQTNAKTVELGITFPLARPIEIGAGAGWIQFDTVGITTRRATLTPLRVVIKPLFFIPQHQKQDWLAFLKYYVKETVIIGRLRGEDFGVDNSVFDNKTSRDFVTSAGFIIDLGEVFYLLHK
jgi:hypothetical protein